MPGATNATWTVTATAPADEGDYIVRVSNDVGAVESAPARLTVLVPPYLIQSPVDTTNLAGRTEILSIQAGGTPPLLYQWSSAGTGALTQRRYG